jgi:2-polyprenyl-3-methyl-5-hydroxy-6-metoxy-1,4-benzoquinol methylase/NTP pyrophosphatase (non-canonical NTP hydrolase)
MNKGRTQDFVQDQKEVWNIIAEAWTKLVKDPHEDPNREKILLPTLENLLGDVRNKSILDIGCGEGSVCRFLAKKGARVTGLDFSEKMIQFAEKQTSSTDQVQYVIGYAEEADTILAKDEFDICIANMTMIDIGNINLVVSKISRILKADGEFIFSILHPCFPLSAYETAERVINDSSFNNPEKYEWPHESYFNRKEIYRKIRPSFPLASRFYKRMLEEYFWVLAENDFVVACIIEPRPPREVIEDESYEAHGKYPLFPLFLFVKALNKKESLKTDLLQREILNRFLQFREERNWAKFQTIKNNAISLCLEASEFLEHFQWLEKREEFDNYVEKHQIELEDELADVYMNLLLLANDLGVDLNKAAKHKVDLLSRKYPKYRVYGESIKPLEKNKERAKKRFR